MIRCLVIEDELLAQNLLKKYIDDTAELELSGVCANALEAFEYLSKHGADLLFLDIKLPGITGTEFIKMIKQPPPVIFTTAFSEFATQSYELDAVDYLLKPITYERFLQSVARYLKRYTAPDILIAHTFFKINGSLLKIRHADIIFAQSVKDYLVIHTVQDQYVTHLTMKNLTLMLPATCFTRVHKSYLINNAYISKIDKRHIELGGTVVPLGDYYKGNLPLL